MCRTYASSPATRFCIGFFQLSWVELETTVAAGAGLPAMTVAATAAAATAAAATTAVAAAPAAAA